MSAALRRYAVHRELTVTAVVATFLACAAECGLPASTLTDNGMVYTTRLAGGRGGRNAFEHQLHTLGITQKNSSPNHPQTQGKIERFHQTLKRWLTGQPPAHTLEDLNEQLEKFRHIYNHERPHRAWTDAHPEPPTVRHPKQHRPERNRETTGAGGSTASTNSGNSPSATQDSSATSASAAPMPASTS